MIRGVAECLSRFEGEVPEPREHGRFPTYWRKINGLRVGECRQTLLAVASQPSFGQDGYWNVSQTGNVGLNGKSQVSVVPDRKLRNFFTVITANIDMEGSPNDRS